MADKDTHPHHHYPPPPPPLLLPHHSSSSSSATTATAPSATPPPRHHHHHHHRLNTNNFNSNSNSNHAIKNTQISHLNNSNSKTPPTSAVAKLKPTAAAAGAPPPPGQHHHHHHHHKSPIQGGQTGKTASTTTTTTTTTNINSNNRLGILGKHKLQQHPAPHHQHHHQPESRKKAAQQQGGGGGGGGGGASTSRPLPLPPSAGAKLRSLSEEDSPKKKKLKLILKLRKPGHGGEDVECGGASAAYEQQPQAAAAVRSSAPPGVRSKSNGVGSAGLGSPGHGSRASPAGSSRFRHPEGRSGNGAPGGAGAMELRHRSMAGSATSSESMEVEECGVTPALLSGSKKRKVRDRDGAFHPPPPPPPPPPPQPPERKVEDKVAVAVAVASEDDRRMSKDKEKDSRGVPTSGQVQGGSPSHTVMEDLLEKFQKKDTYGVFAEPVDPEEIPDYLDIIKEPMDFSTIKKKLSKGVYTTIDTFERDVMLICSNAMKYNAPKTIYYKQAKAIKDIARKSFDLLKGRLNGQRRAPGRPAKTKRYATKRTAEIASSDCQVAASVSDGKRASTAERHAEISHKSNSSGNDLEFPEGSLPRSVSLKEHRRLLTVDENRRHTYKPLRSSIADSAVQLVPFGYQPGGSYAQSLALFGANCNRMAWEFVARKIRKVLAPGVPFGPGWVGDNETSTTENAEPREVAKETVETPSTAPSASTGFPVSNTTSTSLPLAPRSLSSPATPTPAPNNLFDGFAKTPQQLTFSGPPGKHWIQNSAPAQQQQVRNTDATVQQIRSTEASGQQMRGGHKEFNEPQTRSHSQDANGQMPRSDASSQHADGSTQLFQANRTFDLPSRKQDSNFQLYTNLEKQQVRKTDLTQQLRNGDTGIQASRSAEAQARTSLDVNAQLKTGIDINSLQVRNCTDGQARSTSIDVNVQQPRNSTEAQPANTQQPRSSIDVNCQQLRKPEQHLRPTDSSRFAPETTEAGRPTGPPKFGGSVGFPGMDTSRAGWSLQRALAQDSALRDGNSVQRVFGKEQVTGRSSGETGAVPSFSSPAFANMPPFNNNGPSMGVAREMFQLPGLSSQGMMSKLAQSVPARKENQPVRHISDLNSRSDNAEFFRQPGLQPEQGVYNVISQSLLQPWKSQQQQRPTSLRQLPPDLNVRLQSPKSPQHQPQQLQLQQHQHQHQQQVQQQQQMQQPDLALQL